MIIGTISNGFEFSVDESLFDDYELFELICSVDRGDVKYLPEMAKTMLGVDQYEQLKSHIRNDSGKVSSEIMMKSVMEIFQTSKQLKKS